MPFDPQSLIDALDESIGRAVDDYQARALRAQRRVAANIVAELNALDRDKNGFIKSTVKNIKKANRIKARLPDLVNDRILESSIGKLTDEVAKIQFQLETFLLSVFGNQFDPKKPILEALRENAILLTRNTLGQAGMGRMLVNEIENIITSNLNGSVTFRDMVQQMTDFLEGPGNEVGPMARWAKTTIRDGMAQYSRNYLLSAARQMDIKWFLYSGPTVKGSRKFCKERKGNYYTFEEIQSWSGLEWAGKNKQTTPSNIIVLLGGHGCIDQAIPTPEEFVPAEDRARVA